MKQKLHLLGVVLGLLLGIVFLNAGFLLILLGLLPSVVAYFVDGSPRKDFYRAIRSCNLVGVLLCIAPLAPSYPHLGAAMQVIMSDPQVWLIIYGAAAAGWVLVGFCRLTSYVMLLITGEARAAQLEKARADLVAEWGDAITQAKSY